MAEKKFSELSTASQINETDITAISQETSNVWGSFKATIGAIAQKIITGINFANAFNTNAKTVAGAVNEKLTANAVADIEVSPAESAHSEGDYLIYNGLLYLVIDDIAIGDALTTGAGGNIETAQIADGIGGGGGHEILNDAGSALPQENKLQFKGVYSHDDSTNGKTVVDVTREMTAAEFEQLPAAEKVGVIRITDDNFVCDSTEVKHSTGVSVKQKLDSIDSQINTLPQFIHDGIAQNETKNYTFSNGVRFGTVVITRGGNAMYSLSNRGAFILVNDSSITLSYNQNTGELSITNANLYSEICIMYYVS